MKNELKVTCTSGTQLLEGRESYEAAQLKTKRQACPARQSPDSPATPRIFPYVTQSSVVSTFKQKLNNDPRSLNLLV